MLKIIERLVCCKTFLGYKLGALYLLWPYLLLTISNTNWTRVILLDMVVQQSHGYLWFLGLKSIDFIENLKFMKMEKLRNT